MSKPTDIVGGGILFFLYDYDIKPVNLNYQRIGFDRHKINIAI